MSSLNVLRRCKVLLIEDERVIREIIVRMLRNIGVTEITEAASAETGWAYLAGEKNRPFHVVITDLTLPGMSGGALIRKIRELPSLAAKVLPIIVLTGSTDLVTYKKVAEHKVSSYLIKPISGDMLRAAIEKAVIPSAPEASAAG
jgi:two-component system chemotaxis response regulator CheY